MYTLVTVADVVEIHPRDFHKPSKRAIEDWINTKYADKVIHKIGLCVGFHSLISASEGLIGHGTGIVNVNVDFRLVVFRPFKGEIIRGTISSSNESGIHMSMGFFEDIVAPAALLFAPSQTELEEGGSRTWVWKADENDFYFDRTEKCLMRVEQETWTDLSPQMKKLDEDFDMEARDAAGLRSCPYRLTVSMALTGLGPDLWWLGEQAEAAEEAAKAPENVEETNEVEMAA
ncbi:DNA-directed RNA polymerase III complex subunit Rpc25 [Elasticomyces elasticus]|uniref:DNA-directed RNA polymerase subunit n=1 Tax=Elasticomyces elasticus TaxID=574655 RepID=A0AAN7W4W1_9PEZI|nr:DNA-directed RNA polymerase III complex subunit Rpc25 [Elasticomyces elasticus]